MEGERGLAGAIGTEERDPLALGDRQIDTPQRLPPIRVGEPETADFQHRDHEPTNAITATTTATVGATRATSHWVLVARRRSSTGISPV